jgi:hypothetical protein
MLFPPHLIEFTLEIIFVHAQFIACGLAMVMCVISIVSKVKSLSSKIGASTGQSAKVQRRIMRLGMMCAVLLVFNVVQALLLFSIYPQDKLLKIVFTLLDFEGCQYWKIQ